MNPLSRALLVVGLGCLGASPLAAQGQGGPNAFSVTRLSDLSFGILTSGSAAVITPSGTGAGLFVITGPKKSQLALSFALPGNLTGPASLPITFGAGSAAWAPQNVAAGARSFNPSQGTAIPMPDTRTVYVWIGGTVVAGAAQASGSYTSTVTLSVAIN